MNNTPNMFCSISAACRRFFLLAMAMIAIAACSADTDTTELTAETLSYTWEDFPEELAHLSPEYDEQDAQHEAEDKIVVVRHHGRKSVGGAACYTGTGTHDCTLLPNTKDFFYAVWPGHGPSNPLQQVIWDAMRASWSYYTAPPNPTQQQLWDSTGFSWTEVDWYDPRRNVIINIDNIADGGAWASGGCNVQTSIYNSPSPIGYHRFYGGCEIHVNLGDAAAYAWAAYPPYNQYGPCLSSHGYEIDPWAVGWWLGSHEGGHVQGFAHLTPENRVMYKYVTCDIVNNGDWHSWSHLEREVLRAYKPTGAGFALDTIPGFDPYSTL